MNVTEALDEAANAVPTESAQDDALVVLAAELARMQGLSAERERQVRADERERLAALFEANAETLRSFTPDGLSIDALCFLLRLSHD